MKKLLLIAVITFTVVFVFRASGSYFSDTETSINNTFAAASDFGFTPAPTGITPTTEPMNTPTPTPLINHIVINEVYPDSNQSNEWVEIYNPTYSSVSLDGWTIGDGDGDTNIPAGLTLLPGQYGVIVTISSTQTVPTGALKIQLSTNSISNGFNNSHEEIYLKQNSTTIIDSMDYGDTIIFNPKLNAPNKDKSVQRKPNIPDTDTTADWITNAIPTFGTTNN